MKIKRIIGSEVLDSRGNPTVAVTIILDNDIQATAMVPSGASTGEHEALELRDGDPHRYHGKGVLKAISHIDFIIAPKLQGFSVSNQQALDQALLDLDGTPNKSNLGANALLGVSLAAAKASAKFQNKPLFITLCNDTLLTLPTPMMNILNGGAHANNSLDIQEFMIQPSGISPFPEQLRAGSEIFHTLKKLLDKYGFSTAVGDEGGFAPNLTSNQQALDLIIQAIETAGYKPGEEITIALDSAASFFYKEGGYLVDKKGKSQEKRTPGEQVDFWVELTRQYPITSLEDGMDENDWEGWSLLTQKLGKSIQLVGDDLFVTNPRFLQRGIDEHVANAILIKPNQIGTLTETLETITLAQKHGYKTVISHRSGETEDTTIADLAVATNAGQIKTGSLSRSERTAKYNRLLNIYGLLKDSMLN